LKAPSTAIKLGFDLKRLIKEKWGIAFRMQDDESVDDCNGLMKVMKFESAVRFVAKIATTTLLSRSYNKDRALQDPDDFYKLQNTIKEIQKLDFTDTCQNM
jgi:hypothetical protein